TAASASSDVPAPIAIITAAAPARNGCVGTRPTCANGVRSTSQPRSAEERADRLPQERDADEAVGDAGAGAGNDGVGERGDAQEEERGGDAVRARLEQPQQRDADSGRGGPEPGG